MKRELAYVIIGALIALFIAGQWRGCVKVRKETSRAEQYRAQKDSVVLLNARTQRGYDSLMVVVENERQQQVQLDAIDDRIQSDPRWVLGTYRDSSTVAKLQFLHGLR